MLKKIPFILCLIMLNITNYCMEQDISDLTDSEEAYSPYASGAFDVEAALGIKKQVSKANVNLKKPNLLEELQKLIDTNDEEALNDFCTENYMFTFQNAQFIFLAVSEKKLLNMVKFLKQNYTFDLDTLIRSVLLLGDISELKELTQFDLYANDDRFNFTDYLSNLIELGIPVDMLDEMFLQCRTNYRYSLPISNRPIQRYLQDLIRSGKPHSLIFKFIAEAPLDQLNAQEEDGTTALHAAVAYWDRAHQESNNEEMKYYEEIIRALLKRNVDLSLENSKNIKAIDSQFFQKYYEQRKKECVGEITHNSENSLSTIQAQIEAALQANDIEEVKRLIQFNNFLDQSGQLDKVHFLNHLANFALDDSLMDKIFLSDKVNYLDTLGDRHLQTLIRTNMDGKYTKVILEFIENASLPELNAQDQSGTALHEAVTLNNKYQRLIIKALLENGADSEIKNRLKDKPSDSVFFRKNKYFCKQCQRKYQRKQTQKIQLKESIKKKKYLAILTVTSLTVVGVAAFCLYYKLGNKSIIDATINLKQKMK